MRNEVYLLILLLDCEEGNYHPLTRLGREKRLLDIEVTWKYTE